MSDSGLLQTDAIRLLCASCGLCFCVFQPYTNPPVALQQGCLAGSWPRPQQTLRDKKADDVGDKVSAGVDDLQSANVLGNEPSDKFIWFLQDCTNDFACPLLETDENCVRILTTLKGAACRPAMMNSCQVLINKICASSEAPHMVRDCLNHGCTIIGREHLARVHRPLRVAMFFIQESDSSLCGVGRLLVRSSV